MRVLGLALKLTVKAVDEIKKLVKQRKKLSLGDWSVQMAGVTEIRKP